MPEKVEFGKEKKSEERGPAYGQVFQEYVNDLKLTTEDLKKKILDVGSGEGQFAKYLRELKINQEVYGLERSRKELSSSEKSVEGEATKLPFKNESFEMVISHESMPTLLYLSEDTKKAVKESISEMLRVLKKQGEIRLGPVAMWNKAEAENASALKETIEAFEQELDSLASENKVSVSKIPLERRAEYFVGELDEFLYKIKKL